MIEHLKKGDMATQSEALLADAGWLPEPLRTAGVGKVALDPDDNADYGHRDIEDDGDVHPIPDDEHDYAVAAE